MWPFKEIRDKNLPVQNIDQKLPRKVNIIDQIVYNQLLQTRKDISDWVSAVNQAKSPYNPDRTDLIDVYRDISIDGHLSGIITSIKNKVKAKPYMIVDQSGNEDKDKTKLFNQEWFVNFIEWSIDSMFYGYSLIQISDIKNDTFRKLELIPREYVIPEKQLVKRNLYAGTIDDGIYYSQPPYDRWTIFLGNNDLGLLHKVVPHAIAKKNLLISCWDNAELFGMPIRIVYTDITDEDRRRNAELMLKKMGKLASGVLDSSDKIDFQERNSSDAYNVFLQPYETSNKEMSKALGGQTGIFDEKSFVGSAEVHERLFDDYISSYCLSIEFQINNILIPKMLIHRIPLDGYMFKWKSVERLSTKEKVEIIKNLAPFVKFDDGFIEEYTGLKCEQKTSENTTVIPDNTQSIMRDVMNYYNDHGH